MANPPGDHSHLIDFPEALEALFSRIGELKLVLGAAAEPGLNEVERLLREGLAARGRGNPGWYQVMQIAKKETVAQFRGP